MLPLRCCPSVVKALVLIRLVSDGDILSRKSAASEATALRLTFSTACAIYLSFMGGLVRIGTSLSALRLFLGCCLDLWGRGGLGSATIPLTKMFEAKPIINKVDVDRSNPQPKALSPKSLSPNQEGMVLIKMLGAAAAQIAGKLNILVTVALP